MSTALIDSAVWEKWRQFEVTESSPGFFLELLQTALTSSQPLMANLAKAMDDQDLKNTIYFSHTLSSTCRSLGATQLSGLLKDIEWAARANSPAIKSELMPVIQKMFEAFCSELKLEIARIKGS